MKTKIATGAFMWAAAERRTKRYGTIFPSRTTSTEDVIAHASIDSVAINALSAKRVKIVCRVLATRESGHCGDAFLGIKPTADVAFGDEVTVGVGTLVVEFCPAAEPFGIAFGLKPSDGRKELWMDPRILYRLHEQTVDFLIEETDEPDSPMTDLRYGDTSGAIVNPDGTLQFLGGPFERGRVKPKIENLGGGLLIVHPPDLTPGNRVEVELE